jgi:hypothetical protein
MTMTIARRDLDRRLHPAASAALRMTIAGHLGDASEAGRVVDAVNDADWLLLTDGDETLLDKLDDAGLLAFVNASVILED